MNKKLICTAIAVSMLVSGFSAVSYAAETANASTQVTEKKPIKQYEEVLALVKAKITVPEKLNKFEVNTGYNEDKKTIYNFHWYTDGENDDYSTLGVSADENGAIFGFEYFDRTLMGEEHNGVTINDISKEEIRAEIESQIKKIIPEKFEKLEIKEDAIPFGNGYTISYYHVENGMKVYSDYVNASAYINDGKLILSNISTEWTDKEYTVPENMIAQADAEKLYMEKARYCLNYGTRWEKRNEYSAFLRYSFKNDVVIDAVTGEAEEDMKYSYRTANTMGAAKEEMSADTGAAFSPAEQEELDKISKFLLYEEAEKKAREIKELGIKDDMTVEHKSINKNGDYYRLSLTFTDKDKKLYSHVVFDAENGDLYMANTYNDDYAEKEITSEQKENAAKKAAEFAKTYIPVYYSKTKQAEVKDEGRFVRVTFERLSNGIPLGNDAISVSWDAYADKLVSVNVVRSNIMKIPEVKDTVNIDEAYKTTLDGAKLERVYIRKDNKMKVVYAVLNQDKANIDAVKGVAINYNGYPIDEFTGYGDIVGHWAEDKINALADYNIRVSGGLFHPDENVKQKDFLRLIYAARSPYWIDNEDELYQTAIRSGLITKEEKNPDAPVTKQQAVMYLLKLMEYDKAAEIRGIYKCDFADADKIAEKYFGYAAIAKGLGIVNGDESGNFNPDTSITNAQTAVMIYNYLKK